MTEVNWPHSEPGRFKGCFVIQVYLGFWAPINQPFLRESLASLNLADVQMFHVQMCRNNSVSMCSGWKRLCPCGRSGPKVIEFTQRLNDELQ